jgi:DNA polymerase-3 subunit beta
MKFKINRDHFANGLAQVLNVVGSKATMPILSNVLIEAEKDQISLTTTNLDLGIRCKIKADVKETGAVTLPVKRLTTIVRELPNVDVTFDASPNHQVKLASGGSNFRIMGIGKEEFPPLPEFGDEKAFTLEQAELTTMLKSVAYAQSSDETRYILNGVYFNFKDGKLSLVATDGRRMSALSSLMPDPNMTSPSLVPGTCRRRIRREWRPRASAATAPAFSADGWSEECPEPFHDPCSDHRSMDPGCRR